MILWWITFLLSYLKKHPGISGEKYDSMIVRGMATQHLVIGDSTASLLQLHSTASLGNSRILWSTAIVAMKSLFCHA